ncbi:hypothetical protein BGZ80_009781 [Entomortierella chlamydospora]|uniref:Uncharacterized protein n=1 Tax=Entomortierella chlamydospora TaxID=101097 RepID=A0A9P6T087_9FUNG|nr:hypothetical protein BGZ79_010889 [Entomortierella chlamydospora]KAG0015562.1 hypothetical protein BGZ80_009781 [Entomortierella chlamydospora]
MNQSAQSSSQPLLRHSPSDYEQEAVVRTTVTYISEFVERDGEEESLETNPYSCGEPEKGNLFGSKADSISNAKESETIEPLIHNTISKNDNDSPMDQLTLSPSSQSPETKLLPIHHEDEESEQPQQTQYPQSSTQQSYETGSKSLTKPSRLAIPRAIYYRTSPGERSLPRYQTRTLNRLEVENAYLTSQNSSLNKDIQYCRQTVQALKHILAQKEEMIDRMRSEFQRAYLKTKFMESILAEHQNFGGRGFINPASGSEEEMFFQQGFEGQDDQQLEYLMRQLREDGLSEEEDISDESESISDDQDMPVHELGTDEEEDRHDHDEDHNQDDDKSGGEELYQVESSKSQEQNEGLPSPSSQRFRELSLGMSSHATSSDDRARMQSEHALETTPLSQSIALHNPSSESSRKPGSSRHQVIRRRPRLQLSPTSSVSMSTLPSAMEVFKDSLAMPSEGSNLNLTSSSPAARPDSAMGFNNGDENAERMTRQNVGCALRDSGHFPSEFFSLDEGNISYHVTLTEPIECQSPVNGLHFEFVCVSEPLTENSGDEEEEERAVEEEEDEEEEKERLTCSTTDPAKIISYRDISLPPDSYPHLGTSPPTALPTLLAPIHIEASASSTTLTTGSTISLEVGRVNGDRDDDDALLLGSNQRVIDSSKDPSEYDFDEDKSESSSTTMMAPLTRASDDADTPSSSTTPADVVTPLTASPQVGAQSTLVRDEESSSLQFFMQQDQVFHVEHENTNGIEDPPLLLGSNTSSKIKGKAGLYRDRSKTLPGDKSKSKLNPDSISPASTLLPANAASVSGSTSITKTLPVSTDSADSADTESTSARMVSEKQENSTPFLSRIWRLFAGSRQPTRGAKYRRRTIDAGTDDRAWLIMDEEATARPTSPMWNGALKGKKSAESVVTGKGSGIRRLGSRSRSRTQLTSTVESRDPSRDGH